DDGDDHQELDQGEGSAGPWSLLLGPWSSGTAPSPIGRAWHDRRSAKERGQRGKDKGQWTNSVHGREPPIAPPAWGFWLLISSWAAWSKSELDGVVGSGEGLLLIVRFPLGIEGLPTKLTTSRPNGIALFSFAINAVAAVV